MMKRHLKQRRRGADPKWLARELRTGNLTLGQIIGLTEQEAAAVAEVAEMKRRQGDLRGACAVYGLLVSFAPMTPRYWAAIARLKQRLGDLVAAAACYEVVATLGDRDAENTQREAYCYQLLGEAGLAKALSTEAKNLR